MKRTIASAFAFVFFGKLTIIVAGAIITPILMRILGPAQYGQYAVVVALFGILQILVTSGVTSGAKKFISEDRNYTGWTDHVWGYYSRLATLLSLLFAVTLIGAAQFGLVDRYLGAEYVTYTYFLAILTFVVQYRDYVNRALMGLHLESYSEPLRILRKLSFGAIAISLAALGYGVAGVLTGKILAGCLVIGAGLYLLRGRIDLSSSFKPLPTEFPKEELRSFSNLSIIYVFLLTSLYHVDVLMLEGAVSDSEVGYYKGALVLAELLWVAPRALQNVMIQSVSQDWLEGNIDRINSVASRSTRYILLFTLLCSIGLWTLADEFVPFYFGSDYAPAVEPLLLLLPGTIAFAVSRPLLTITHAKGEMRPLILATGVAAVANLILNAILIPSYGMAGAAIATTLGYGSLGVSQFFCARYVGYQPFDIGPFVRIGATCLLAGPIILYAGMVLTGYVALLVVPPLGGVVFGLAAILTGAVPRTDLEKVTDRIASNQYIPSVENKS